MKEVDAEALERNLTEPARPGLPSRRLVNCGRLLADQRVRDRRSRDPPALAGRADRARSGSPGRAWRAATGTVPRRRERTFGARLADDPEKAWLRTGDLGFLAEGSLFLTGRAKDLIILRGRNLYPQDMERTAERSHPGLRPGCGAAFAVEVGGEERLVVVQEVERDAERRWSRERRFPGGRRGAPGRGRGARGGSPRRGPGARRDRAQDLQRQDPAPVLPGGFPRRQAGAVGRVAAGERPLWKPPRTPTEERLERIWAEVLRRRAGGGRAAISSRWAATRSRRRRSSPGSRRPSASDLPLDALFVRAHHRRPGHAAGARDGAGPEGTRRSEPVERSGSLPLSFAQRRLWFLHQLDPDNPVHNIAAAVRLAGPSRRGRPRRGVRRDRAAPRGAAHGFPRGAGGRAGAGGAARRHRCPLPDPRDLGRRSSLEEVGLATIARAALRPGARAVPARGLLRLRTRRSTSWCSPSTTSRRTAARSACWCASWRRSTRRSPRAGPRRWRRCRCSTRTSPPGSAAGCEAGVLEAGLAFWRGRLGGELPVVELPADRPRPAVLSHRGAHHERFAARGPGGRLEEPARARDGPRRFMALLAGFAALLHRYTGLGRPGGGHAHRRPQPGGAGRADRRLPQQPRAAHRGCDGEPGFRELLARVRRDGARRLRPPGGARSRGWWTSCGPARDLSRTPLFQVMFVGQNAPLRRLELPGLSLEPAGDRPRHGPVRPVALHGRGGRRLARHLEVQHRPVRRADDGAHGGPLREPAGRGRGRAGRPVAPAARGSADVRAPAGGGRLERHGGVETGTRRSCTS